jgi:5-methyltetrahydrofolate--homocysteine methyltransferase
MSVLKKIQEATMAGKAENAVMYVREAIEQGLTPESIIQDGFIVAMSEVGEKFKNGEVFVPEMLVAARAMQFGINEMKPLMAGDERKYLARMVIGTVKGDLHDVGKNLVSMMLEGNGAEIIDLGVDVPTERFVEAVKEHKPQFLGLSSLLTTTMPMLGEVIKALEEAGIRDSVKVLVGGAPVSEQYAQKIGADGYGKDAIETVDLIKGAVKAV